MSIEVLRGLDGSVMLMTMPEAPTADQRAAWDASEESQRRRAFRARLFRVRFAFRVRAIQSLIGLGIE